MSANYRRRCADCGVYTHRDECVLIKVAFNPNARKWRCIGCLEKLNQRPMFAAEVRKLISE